MNPDDPLSHISRVGPATATRFKKLGIATAKDLLYHFPVRYDDFTETTPINDVIPGNKHNIQGEIELIQNKRSHKKRLNITEALVKDDSGEIKIIWFNQSFITKNLKTGDRVSLSGKIEKNYGYAVMVSPVYEKISSKELIHTKGLIPNYGSTEGITQKQIRFLISEIIPLTKVIKDWLPEKIIKNLGLFHLREAIYKIHFPQTLKEAERARQRLAFNELFLFQLKSQLIRREIKSQKSQKLKFFEAEIKKFVQSLPFTLTNAQRKSGWEVIRDLQKSTPMSRLLEGDVGSGKTMVSILAVFSSYLNRQKSGNNYQSVLMVPTEILAEQHFNSFCKLFQNYNFNITLLTRGNKKNNFNKNDSKKNILKDISSGSSHLIIGTHSLIQEEIKFKNLVLAIIDEQHRFGVEQRKKIMEKSGDAKSSPHLLSMTATPIPRSLALVFFGDLDVSIIDEMPKGRKPIITKIIPENQRNRTYEFIRQQINKGEQVFVICPLIESSEKMEVKSVNQEFQKLSRNIFPDLSVGVLHGKLKQTEKENVMRDFLKGKYNILLSTSVVEVGVDVPNATIMAIEGAERFGLSQLHQFRGRVGRGSNQSYCFLFTESESKKTQERLSALSKYQDGFNLAKMDLKLRGAGDMFGTAQKGFPEFKLASLFDYKLMKKAQEEAKKLTEKSPDLSLYPFLSKKLNYWKKNVHLE